MARAGAVSRRAISLQLTASLPVCYRPTCHIAAGLARVPLLRDAVQAFRP